MDVHRLEYSIGSDKDHDERRSGVKGLREIWLLICYLQR